MSSDNVAKLLLTLYEEQSKMYSNHAERLRKALGDAAANLSESEAEGGKKKRKSAGDKTKVKRALSGFQLFMKDHLHSYKQKHPELQQKEVLTIISQRWKSLDETKKNEYLEKAKDQKASAPTATAVAAPPAPAKASSSSSSSSQVALPAPTSPAPAAVRAPAPSNQPTTEKKRKHDDEGEGDKKKHKKHKKDKKESKRDSDDE